MRKLETLLNQRILLIDDNPAIHEDFRKILNPSRDGDSLVDAEAAFFGEVEDVDCELQLEIDSASQGVEGRDKVVAAVAEGRPYAMAFVDMRMPPGWDGLTTIEHLWKADPDLEVVICTAFSDKSWQDICNRLGWTDQLLILKKPFDTAEVSQLALALTEKWRLRRQSRIVQDELEQLVAARTAEVQEKDLALSQKQRLESIGALAGGVAHEFNNLLHVIHGYTRFAQHGLDENEKPFQDLQEVLKASDRATSLASQLLCFSRNDEFKPRSIVVRSMLEDLARLVKPVIREDVKVVIDLPPDELYTMADPSGLQQVLLNLCVNARDAMPEGGELHIESKLVTATPKQISHHELDDDGPFVRISVADTGTGMTPDHVTRIFEPFFTTKEIGKGTGLGLSMVHGFVRRHGGLIDVDTEPGQGTTFHILLPVADAPPAEKAAPVEVVETDGLETILLADDERVVRAVNGRYLEDAGYTVLMAVDGEDAVKQFKEHRDEIDLVLLDVMMPNLNGRLAWDQIKEIDSNVAVIFCTGYAPSSSEAKTFAQESLAMIQKPCSADVLLIAVRAALDNARNPEATLQTS